MRVLGQRNVASERCATEQITRVSCKCSECGVVITSLLHHSNEIKVYVMAKLIGVLCNLGVLNRPLVFF